MDATPDDPGGELAIAILVARRPLEDVAKRLLRGAEQALDERGVPAPDVIWVPTALELPVVALALAEKGGPDAIVALGAVVDDEIAAMQCLSGLMQVQLDTGVPIAPGILNVEDEDQALAHSGPKNNHGADAALAAVETAQVLREIQG